MNRFFFLDSWFLSLFRLTVLVEDLEERLGETLDGRIHFLGELLDYAFEDLALLVLHCGDLFVQLICQEHKDLLQSDALLSLVVKHVWRGKLEVTQKLLAILLHKGLIFDSPLVYVASFK
jgi:hypothetical protein